jgi:hypothetical protein
MKPVQQAAESPSASRERLRLVASHHSGDSARAASRIGIPLDSSRQKSVGLNAGSSCCAARRKTDGCSPPPGRTLRTTRRGGQGKYRLPCAVASCGRMVRLPGERFLALVRADRRPYCSECRGLAKFHIGGSP